MKIMMLLTSKTINLKGRFLKKVIEMRLDENLFIRIFLNHIRSNKIECMIANNLTLTRKGLIALLAFPADQLTFLFWPIFTSWSQFYTEKLLTKVYPLDFKIHLSCY